MTPPPTEHSLRLLVVSSDTYPPFRVDVAVLFARELAGRGHRIDWILQSEAACRRAYVTVWGGGTVWVGATDLGTTLFHSVKKHLRGLVNDLRIFPRLRTGEYDAIEVKDKFIAGIFAVIASRLYRTKFIYWLSYPFPEHYLAAARDGTARHPVLYLLRGAFFKWLLYRVLLPAAEHVFVQSEQMREDIAAQGIAADKMTAIPMGIDASLGEAPDLSKHRTHMPRGVPAARLYVVGGGNRASDEQILVDEAARLGVGASVTLVGKVPRAEALTYVQEADVCASPFYPTPVLRSASPTKLVEYWALGKPVVANDHPEQKRVIEASGGGYCVPYEEHAFAAAIVKLLQDPAAAQLMGRRGRRYVLEHRAYGTIATAVEQRLREIVA
jgi:glycosyltransferase involved in cell wall biosynthesis